MATAKIQTGDTVIVIAGSYKGIQGVVTKVITKKRNKLSSIIRAAVSSVPTIIKYRKANRAFNLPGEMLTTERMINISNLAVMDEKGNATRVKIEFDAKTSKKVRIYSTTKKIIEKIPFEKKSIIAKESNDSKLLKKPTKASK